MSVWQATRAATAALTRTVTGAILAPHETQRLVVSGKTGTCSSATPGKNICVPIDPGGEMVTLRLALVRTTPSVCHAAATDSVAALLNQRGQVGDADIDAELIEQRGDLPAMMRLVVEDMSQHQPGWLDVRLAGAVYIVQRLVVQRIRGFVGEVDDGHVHRLTVAAQSHEIGKGDAVNQLGQRCRPHAIKRDQP